MQSKRSVWYTNGGEAQWQRASDENKLKERMVLLAKPKLLILDELGYLGLESFAAAFLFQLVPVSQRTLRERVNHLDQ